MADLQMVKATSPDLRLFVIRAMSKLESLPNIGMEVIAFASAVREVVCPFGSESTEVSITDMSQRPLSRPGQALQCLQNPKTSQQPGSPPRSSATQSEASIKKWPKSFKRRTSAESEEPLYLPKLTQTASLLVTSSPHVFDYQFDCSSAAQNTLLPFPHCSDSKNQTTAVAPLTSSHPLLSQAFCSTNPTPSNRPQKTLLDADLKVLHVSQMSDDSALASKYLQVSDLYPGYRVSIFTDVRDNVDAAIRDIEAASVVGVDAEYRSEWIGNGFLNFTSYIQIALPDKGFVFNIHKLSQKHGFLDRLWRTLSSHGILKVGVGVENDMNCFFLTITKKYRVKASNPISDSCCSLEKALFTSKLTQTMSLSDLSYRYLGKFMRKNEKNTKAGGKPEITNELQAEYVILDALAPLQIYSRFGSFMLNLVPSSAHLHWRSKLSVVVIDRGLLSFAAAVSSQRVRVECVASSSRQALMQSMGSRPDAILLTADRTLTFNSPKFNVLFYITSKQLLTELERALQRA